MDPKTLARAFSYQLRQEIGLIDLMTVIRLNREEENKNICHSHDFCDANMVMLDAGVVLGYWTEENFDLDDCSAIVNDAWAIAKAANFEVK